MNSESQSEGGATVMVAYRYYRPGYKAGGPVKSVENLVCSLPKQQFLLLTSDRDLGDATSYNGIKLDDTLQSKKNLVVIYLSSSFAGLKRISLIIRYVLRNNFSLLYIQSLFDLIFGILPLVICNYFLNRPVLVAPRGIFSKGAFEIKSNRKKFFLRTLAKSGLLDDIYWHATSIEERDDIVRTVRDVTGLKIQSERISVIENLVSDASQVVEILPKLTSCASPASAGLRLVFMSRVSEKKNLTYALEVLCMCTNDICFDVYGPREDESYWRECLTLIEKLPSNVKFNYLGVLAPSEVVETLTCYDLFFLPTKGENFGHAIVESLGCGLPVLISDQTPWSSEMSYVCTAFPLECGNQFSAYIDKFSELSVEERAGVKSEVLAYYDETFLRSDMVERYKKLFESF